MSVIKELQRRNVVRALLARVVGVLVFIEGVNIVAGTFAAPDRLMEVVDAA